MLHSGFMRRTFVGALFSLGMIGTVGVLFGEEPRSRDTLLEPVVKVAKKTNDVQSGTKPPVENTLPATSPTIAAVGIHPLDPALVVARNALNHLQADITDYSCYILKRERVNGTLLDQETMFAKVRNRKVENGQVKTPFSVYMYFMKPESMKGREVLYIEGKNDGKLMAHESGLAGKLAGTVSLSPTGLLAMRGNRYPITEIGLENLVVKLIEKGERERKKDECEVEFRKNAAINKRPCTVLQVVHPVRREYFEFNLAQVFIDDELNIPIRYAAYSWPAGVDKNPNPKPDEENLLEEYTYLNLKTNVGLTDIDFDLANKDYNFQRRDR